MNTDPNSKRTAIVSIGTGATVSTIKMLILPNTMVLYVALEVLQKITGNTFEDTKTSVKVATVISSKQSFCSSGR